MELVRDIIVGLFVALSMGIVILVGIVGITKIIRESKGINDDGL